MTRSAAILLQILKLGQCFHDRLHESPDEWQARADTIAQSIDVVAKDNLEAAFLTYMAKHEGGNSLSVHVGRLTKNRHGEYVTLWQLNAQLLRWSMLKTGTSLHDTESAAYVAIETFRRHRGTGTLIDGLRGYGGYKRWSPTPRVLARRIIRIERKLDELAKDARS
jgi:hypothetical protein